MRPYVLTIAGFDPSGGAGLVADAKTFEAHGVTGLSICTGVTYQTESSMEGVDWLSTEQVLKQIDTLASEYPISWAKIGMVKDMAMLESILNHLHRKFKSINVIWDPIMESSSGFIIQGQVERKHFEHLSGSLFLLTPNMPEMRKLMPDWGEVDAAIRLSGNCHVILKGGHDSGTVAKDLLFVDGNFTAITRERIMNFDKHGTGCVLSSSILSNLALGGELQEACERAKDYVMDYIRSSETLLGYHHPQTHMA